MTESTIMMLAHITVTTAAAVIGVRYIPDSIGSEHECLDTALGPKGVRITEV